MSSKKYLNKTLNFTFFLNSLCLGKSVRVIFASCVWEMSEIRNRFIQKHKYKTLQAHLQTHTLPASAHCASPNNCYTVPLIKMTTWMKRLYKRGQKELTVEQHKGRSFAVQSYMKGISQASRAE